MGRPKGSKNKSSSAKHSPLKSAPKSTPKSTPKSDSDLPEIKQEVTRREERQSLKSPAEVLADAANILAGSGKVKVEALIPKKRERNIGTRLDVYTSPIEIKVRGTTFWLYGSHLMSNNSLHDHKKNFVNTYNTAEVVRALLKWSKREKQEAPSLDTPRPEAPRKPTSYARFLASCIA